MQWVQTNDVSLPDSAGVDVKLISHQDLVDFCVLESNIDSQAVQVPVGYRVCVGMGRRQS